MTKIFFTPNNNPNDQNNLYNLKEELNTNNVSGTCFHLKWFPSSQNRKTLKILGFSKKSLTNQQKTDFSGTSKLKKIPLSAKVPIW